MCLHNNHYIVSPVKFYYCIWHWNLDIYELYHLPPTLIKFITTILLFYSVKITVLKINSVPYQYRIIKNKLLDVIDVKHHFDILLTLVAVILILFDTYCLTTFYGK